jgi:hypothetical protein
VLLVDSKGLVAQKANKLSLLSELKVSRVVTCFTLWLSSNGVDSIPSSLDGGAVLWCSCYIVINEVVVCIDIGLNNGHGYVSFYSETLLGFDLATASLHR